mmetsp:Transcript_16538/g.43240  ORF Transcript_16538/g.43240 Transcript_16538/m.43240 type:complete len:83 (-) Transcript_16538:1189-1437(-)
MHVLSLSKKHEARPRNAQPSTQTPCSAEPVLTLTHKHAPTRLLPYPMRPSCNSLVKAAAEGRIQGRDCVLACGRQNQQSHIV